MSYRRESDHLLNQTMYRRWFVADTSDVLAVSLRTLAFSLLVYATTESEVITGLCMSAESFISFILMPVGGTLTDRHERRRIMIVANIVGMCLTLMLVVLIAGNHVNSIWLVGIAVLFGIEVGILGPANDAILKSLIEMELFPKAQSMREIRESVVTLWGSAVSAAMYQLGRFIPFLGSMILYAVGLLASLRLPRSASHIRRTVDQDDDSSARSSVLTGFVRDLIEGCVWAWRHGKFKAAVMLGAAVNVAFAMGISGAQISLMARNVDAVLIGLLDTGMGLTTLIGAVVANRIVSHYRTGYIIALAMGVVVCCFVPMVLCDDYYVILIALSAMGLFLPAMNSCLLGFIYGKTPDNMQGRASAVFETSVGFLGALAPVLAGILTQLPHGFSILSAVAMLFAAIAFGIAVCTSLRTIPKPSQWHRTEL